MKLSGGGGAVWHMRGSLDLNTRMSSSHRGSIPKRLIASSFPSLASHPCVLVPPTREAWRDARKPCGERGNEEICFKGIETSFPLKRHVKRRPFLMTAAADHSWISCQPALTAVYVWTVLILIKTPIKPDAQELSASHVTEWKLR